MLFAVWKEGECSAPEQKSARWGRLSALLINTISGAHPVPAADDAWAQEDHAVLDFWLRVAMAGRLLILSQRGPVHGLEPNRWLIEDAIDREIGRDMIDLKRPMFLHHADFSVAPFGTSFDYILAQSIFSHAGLDVVSRCLTEFRSCLATSGLILATFVQPHQLGTAGDFRGSGWVYPECVTYTIETALAAIRRAGLVGRALPWFHPRQTWFAMAHSPAELPAESDDVHLSGIVLRAPGLRPSSTR